MSSTGTPHRAALAFFHLDTTVALGALALAGLGVAALVVTRMGLRDWLHATDNQAANGPPKELVVWPIGTVSVRSLVGNERVAR